MLVVFLLSESLGLPLIVSSPLAVSAYICTVADVAMLMCSYSYEETPSLGMLLRSGPGLLGLAALRAGGAFLLATKAPDITRDWYSEINRH